MLRMHLSDDVFEQVMAYADAPEAHPGPHRVYPHSDVDLLVEEIREVVQYRIEGAYLP